MTLTRAGKIGALYRAGRRHTLPTPNMDEIIKEYNLEISLLK